MTKDESPLREVVLNFYREELRRRYQLINVRRFEEFSGVSDKEISELREFFLSQIYPELEQRDRFDEAFDRLGDMLRSPKKMSPLISAALTTLWRMGTKIPSAVAAGKAAIDAYSKTRDLEGTLIETAKKLKLKAKDSENRGKMVALVQAVPERQVLNLISDILDLFRALTNIEILKVSVAFMEQCGTVMRKRTDLYTEDDLDGFSMGLNLLKGGLALFLKLKPEDLKTIIAGIERIELDWYDRIKKEATN